MGYVEVWGDAGPQLVPLETDRVTVGSDASNAIVVSGDPQVSRLHAALERYPTGWCLKDLASRNGTFVNGERIWGERPLRNGDEIRVGRARLVYRPQTSTAAPKTEAALPAPELTRRERDVLLALCKPVLSGDVFTEPASIRQVAEALVVTEAAVKQHLHNLYEKFGVAGDGERRRVRLANEAIRRSAVTLADLRARP